MKETNQELISRILDEDVSELEAKHIVKEMQTDDELRSTLQRYDMIGHVMRKELPKELNLNFVHNVMSQVEREEMETPDLKHNDVIDQDKDESKFKTFIGLAIAASVAIFSFVAFQNFIQPETDTTPTAVVADRVVEESDIQRVSSEDLQNFISNPEAAASFNSYIMNHAEYASPRVSVPHVRIVGYGKDELEENN